MTPLRERMRRNFRLRDYARNTELMYLRHVAALERYAGTCPSELGPEEIERFLLHLSQEREYATNSPAPAPGPRCPPSSRRARSRPCSTRRAIPGRS